MKKQSKTNKKTIELGNVPGGYKLVWILSVEIRVARPTMAAPSVFFKDAIRIYKRGSNIALEFGTDSPHVARRLWLHLRMFAKSKGSKGVEQLLDAKHFRLCPRSEELDCGINEAVRAAVEFKLPAWWGSTKA